jgi:hypothetical protein
MIRRISTRIEKKKCMKKNLLIFENLRARVGWGECSYAFPLIR